MTIKDEIITIANQLANQGKKPSVALIKNKLSQSAPLPVIISTLKTWVHNPEKTQMVNKAVEESQAIVPEQDINELIAKELQPIKDELAAVKHLLTQALAKLEK